MVCAVFTAVARTFVSVDTEVSDLSIFDLGLAL
jgi:hypothetical protein